MILMCCLIRKKDRDRQMMSNLWNCRPWRLNDVKTQFVSLFVHRRTVFVSDSCDKLGVWKRLAAVIGEVVLLQLQLPEMKSTALLCLLATVGHVSRYPLRNRRFFVRFVQPMKWMGDISTQTGRWETLVSFRGFNNHKSLTSAKRGFSNNKCQIQQQETPSNTRCWPLGLCGLRGYGILYIFFWSHLS